MFLLYLSKYGLDLLIWGFSVHLECTKNKNYVSTHCSSKPGK